MSVHKKRVTPFRRAGTRSWYNRTHYVHGQPFPTFLKGRQGPNLENVAFLAKRVRELVGDPSRCTALEIGPGDMPFLPILPFKKMVFLDQSHEILKKLPTTRLLYPNDYFPKNATLEKKVDEKTRRVVGDIRRLPFNARFDVIIVNEVLTHIRPRERLEVVRALTEHTDAFVILDRGQLSLKTIQDGFQHEYQELSAYANLLKNTQKKSSGSIPVTEQDEGQLEGMLKEAYHYAHLTPAQLRRFQATLTNFKPILRFLQKRGWKTKLIHQRYLVLVAKNRGLS